jgi:Lon protease-like protein
VIQVLRDAITRKKPVAIATDLRRRAQLGEHLTRRPTKEELAEYGTTAEVLGLREEEESTWYHTSFLVVKFHGRQRFRLLEVYRKVNG